MIVALMPHELRINPILSHFLREPSAELDASSWLFEKVSDRALVLLLMIATFLL